LTPATARASHAAQRLGDALRSVPERESDGYPLLQRVWCRPLGKVYRRTKRQEAHEQLITAATMYREMDMRFWLEQAEAELKECT
jgi:hypothetical protein